MNLIVTEKEALILEAGSADKAVLSR